MPGFPTHIVGTPVGATGTQRTRPTIRGSFDFAQDKKAPSRLRASRRYKGSREDKDRSASGKEGRSGHGARREERFLTAQADAFAGANAEEKSRSGPVEKTGGGVGDMRKSACSVRNDGWGAWTAWEVGPFRSIPQIHPGCTKRK